MKVVSVGNVEGLDQLAGVLLVGNEEEIRQAGAMLYQEVRLVPRDRPCERCGLVITVLVHECAVVCEACRP